jgi:hypothetical protein
LQTALAVRDIEPRCSVHALSLSRFGGMFKEGDAAPI